MLSNRARLSLTDICDNMRLAEGFAAGLSVEGRRRIVGRFAPQPVASRSSPKRPAAFPRASAIVTLICFGPRSWGEKRLSPRMAAPFGALGLGPVSVKPHRQREGIGNQLVRMGLEQAREGGRQGVFVVGDPKFYTRFGFDPALAKGFTSRYSGPHLMALALGRKLPTREGVIGYASAFDSLG